MPFREVNVKELIRQECEKDPEFKEIWESRQAEYEIIGQLIKIRNEKGWTQEELAQRIGTKQQVISRIEKKEQSPTLKTICSMANVLDVEIKFTPRQR